MILPQVLYSSTRKISFHYIKKINPNVLGCPPAQDAGSSPPGWHYIFRFRGSQPKPSFATVIYWEGGQPHQYMIMLYFRRKYIYKLTPEISLTGSLNSKQLIYRMYIIVYNSIPNLQVYWQIYKYIGIQVSLLIWFLSVSHPSLKSWFFVCTNNTGMFNLH